MCFVLWLISSYIPTDIELLWMLAMYHFIILMQKSVVSLVIPPFSNTKKNIYLRKKSTKTKPVSDMVDYILYWIHASTPQYILDQKEYFASTPQILSFLSHRHFPNLSLHFTTTVYKSLNVFRPIRKKERKCCVDINY